MGALQNLRQEMRLTLSVAVARARLRAGRVPRFAGAFPTPAAALAAVPKTGLAGYDHDAIVDVTFAEMAQVALWDYPVVHWLSRLARPGLRVVDAGGHLGTKHIAFSRLLDLGALDWTVYDLPAIIRAARARQAAGQLPAAIRFTDTLTECAGVDVLLASGLLQYLDQPFESFLAQLPAPPTHILLNKVATREGASVTTLERIGAARVPYQIRARAGFEAELAAAGYRVLDTWQIPSLAHTIATHPRLGPSISRGYVLERVSSASSAASPAR